MSRGILALAALAGAGGIGSEIVWLRVVDHTVGHMPLAAPLIVACFIVAAGVGGALAPRIERPWLIALASALLDASLLVGLEPVMAATSATLAVLAPVLGLDGAAALLGAALAIPPALLVGAVLPVLMEAAGEGTRAYGAHALGAVVGVAIVEILVAPSLGLRGCLVGLVLVHASCAIGLARRASAWSPPRPARLPWALIVIGAGTGAVQGGWLACASLLERPFALVAPVVVSTMLLGLYLGARAWTRWGGALDRVLLLVGLGGALSLGALAAVVRGAVSGSPLRAAAELVVVVLPVAVPIGAVLPAFLGAGGAGSVDRARAGAALLAVSLGNALGLTAITAATTALAPAPWAVVAGLGVVVAGQRTRRGSGWAILVGAVLLAAASDDRAFVARSAGVPVTDVEIDALWRSPGSVSAIFRAQGQRRLYQTGYQPIDLDARSESLIGAVGAAYAPRHGRALVLGAGSGRSAGAVASVFAQVDVVDLDPHTAELCRALADDNFHLLDQRAVTLHRFDALLAPWVLTPGYDLIVQTVDPGYHALAAKLYTAEHLTRLRRLLAPDGVLILWSDATLSPRANQVLVNTARAVFPQQKLFSAFGGLARGLGVTYYFLVQGAEPLVYRPRMMKFVFGTDRQVRALPLFGGFPPGEIGGAPPSSLDLEPPAYDPDDPEGYRLVRGRFHPTDAIHTADRPERSITFGGAHQGELRVLP